MAKVEYTVDEAQKVRDVIMRDVATLTRRIHIVECAAVCVHMALTGQNADHDKDIAVIVQRCIADELSRVIEYAETLISEIGRLPLAVPPIEG